MSESPARPPGPLPLAAAAVRGITTKTSQRLGTAPGRPRTRPLEVDRAQAGGTEERPAPPPSMRGSASTLPVLGPPGQAVTPRLLDVEAAALYLGALSHRSIRTLIDTGVLRRVRVPLGQGELRRVLVDRLDLDVLIERWKDPQPARSSQ